MGGGGWVGGGCGGDCDDSDDDFLKCDEALTFFVYCISDIVAVFGGRTGGLVVYILMGAVTCSRTVMDLFVML